MLDLTPVSELLENARIASQVRGVLDVREVIDRGFSGNTALYIMPLRDVPQKTSSGTLVEFNVQSHFGVIVGVSTGSANHAGGNDTLVTLIQRVIDTLVGQTVNGAMRSIDMGNGGLLPIKNNGCVLWQQDFYHYHVISKH